MDEVEKEPLVKARVLAPGDSMGQMIFGFKTPKRKEALAKAARRSIHSASTSTRKPSTAVDLTKTLKPYQSKSQAAMHLCENANNGSESEDDSSNDTDENSDVDADEKNSEMSHKLRDENKGNELCDLLDEYFEIHHRKSKVVTSDKTLSKLQNPKMEQQELKEHLKDIQSSHITETINLHGRHTRHFQKWMFQLLCGFNVLIYGLGSKNKLLEQFRKHCLKNTINVVINGYFPNITLKQMLNAITEDLLEKDTPFKTTIEHYSYVKKEFDSDSHGKLFIVVHNIDGQTFRSQPVQTALGHLASSKNIHIIASIDHINAPLIWDQNSASTFNWLWYDCTTFEPYSEETSYENSLMVQQSGTLALSSLIHVLQSLTPNAKGIFKLLTVYQLDNENNAGYQGLSFTNLYGRCRERFLVNSDLTLRAQLTEFKDHKLIKAKKGFDGVEYLTVVVDNTTLKQFMENYNSW